MKKLFVLGLALVMILAGCATAPFQNHPDRFPAVHKPEIRTILNQKRSGLCVGYAVANVLFQNGIKLSSEEIDTLYERSRELYREEGVSIKEEGLPSVRFFLRAAKEKYPLVKYGEVELSPDGIKKAILAYGPIVVGLIGVDFSGLEKWHLIKTKPTVLYYRFGLPEGHAVIIDGWDGNNFSIVNSYGERWGNGGKSWIDILQLRAGLLEAYWLTVK